ncbi:translocation/assembly module TamB domain-containing protein [Pseudopontixanthobacter vadosimaris]|uniref:translocation/assembly module TamB domain-containing protein n=1 Tax=Pseudopontixanthobacter vadosimaris TaxID=2726450 RepID=UPI0014745D5E|nr:translocation/assembly module TamB domain-containing protein [Pseudopontixanthobacter vadosimaris]
MATTAVDESREETGGGIARGRHGARSIAMRFVQWMLGIVLAFALIIVGGVLALDTAPGKRFLIDRIEGLAPASGLGITIGRIEGSIYGSATLHHVALSDPEGVFLSLPRVALDWRPLNWFTSGIDIRDLLTRGGTLYRLPDLRPGDPDSPVLPDFDIRIDRLRIIDLTVAPQIIGGESRTVDLLAQADIRSGRVYANLRGGFGGGDRLYALIDAMPDEDRFDLKLDYMAPAGGVLAGLLGAEADYHAVIDGQGSWTNWAGRFLVERGGARFAVFRLTNWAGEYGIAGQLTPGTALDGLTADLVAGELSVRAAGTLQQRVLEGKAQFASAAVAGAVQGAVDLGRNVMEDLRFAVRLRQPDILGGNLRLEDLRLSGTAEGAFGSLTVEHRLALGRLVSGEIVVTDLRQNGIARLNGSRLQLPVDAEVGRIRVGNDLLDPRLVGGTIAGVLIAEDGRLFSDELRVRFPDTSGDLALRARPADGAYTLAGLVRAQGLQFRNIGRASGSAQVVFDVARNQPWTLRGVVDGRLGQVANPTLTTIAGDNIRFAGGVSFGKGQPLSFRQFRVNASKLQAELDGRITGGRTTLAGRGRHVQFGPFTVEGALTPSGPEAVLVFADPLPQAGLRDVRVALSPEDGGFSLAATGQSLLGPFEGDFRLFAPPGNDVRIAVDRLQVSGTEVTGNLALQGSTARGRLAFAQGGVDGAILLTPRAGGQGFDVDLTVRDARFGGGTPLAIGRAQVDVSGYLADGNSTITGEARAQGVSYGNIFIGRLAAEAELRNGRGRVDAQIAGRRGSQFELRLAANVAPQQIALAAKGRYAGRDITMPRRAMLEERAGGGWTLRPTQVNYGQGSAIARGRFGGGETALNLQLANMPLALLDIAADTIGLGGTISGTVDYNQIAGGLPTGQARVKIDDLTRSGLVLTSRPIDLALVLRLTPDRLETRAVATEGGERRGRLQGRIANLPGQGGLAERLRRGDLAAQLRYGGPASALWRLAAVDTFDLTGPVEIAADVTGTLADPRVRGSLSTDELRLQSAVSGTDVRNLRARGSFNGSRLRIGRFAGTTPNGGTVVGSGTVDLANLGARGPALDIKLAATNALLLDQAGLQAAVTGPLRLVSNGIGGTIAGRVEIERASWRLGRAAQELRLPQIATSDVNLPYDVAPARRRSAPWRYLINAQGDNRIDVEGLGLESEWSADLAIRGTTDDPRIGGEAQVVQGTYSFAGARFDLERGRIDFDVNGPIDPRINIQAESRQNGIDVTVNVEGNAQSPEVRFSSTPMLPEEEILARLLFGGSITDLSATDALQLGAALASLRGDGDGGLDPINSLRNAIGLDRLRIVNADAALRRETGIAIGKNITRRIYVELITDGRGYSATSAEFRITRWLSLLASVSTIGRESVVAEVSRDY